MVLSVFKSHFSKEKAREISCRNFRDFKEDNFNRDLQNRFSAEFAEEYDPFEKVFLDVLNKHAPLKKKVVRADHAPYTTKTLRKTIIKRSYLEKVHFKTKQLQIHQQNLKIKIMQQTLQKRAKKYLESHNPRRVSDNKYNLLYNLFSLKSKILAIR